jgi:electron transfer flavoprotein alpha/beta subunit
MAARLAVSAGERLLVLAWGPPEMAQRAVEEARAAGLPAARIMVRQLSGVAPEQVAEALDASGERLVVLASGACGADNAAVSSLLASSRGVPVLVVER